MRTLLIDNYDSYTYNLFQVIAEVNGGASPATRAGRRLGLKLVISNMITCCYGRHGVWASVQRRHALGTLLGVPRSHSPAPFVPRRDTSGIQQ